VHGQHFSLGSPTQPLVLTMFLPQDRAQVEGQSITFKKKRPKKARPELVTPPLAAGSIAQPPSPTVSEINTASSVAIDADVATMSRVGWDPETASISRAKRRRVNIKKIKLTRKLGLVSLLMSIAVIIMCALAFGIPFGLHKLKDKDARTAPEESIDWDWPIDRKD